MTAIPMEHGLILAALLFSLGLIGVIVRRNLLFVLMSIGLAALATVTRGERAVDTSLAKPGGAAPAAAPAQAPPVADPLSTSAGKPAAGNDAVPLAQ